MRPLLASVAAVGPPALAFAWWGAGPVAHGTALVVIPLFALVTYPLLLRRIAPDTYANFREMSQLLRRKVLGSAP